VSGGSQGRTPISDRTGDARGELSGAEPVAEGLFTRPPEPLRLIGSRCRRCQALAFPRQHSCPRCTSVEVDEHLLVPWGSLWTWTVQCFPPKPPYVPNEGEFEPYPVGYVELAGELRVETRLVDVDPGELNIGMPMELTLLALPGGRVTYAFRPGEEGAP
jgi:uncharacterized OB-fold protein